MSTAKERHKLKLLEYLSNPENEFLNRTQLASTALDICKASLYRHFRPQELTEIEAQALAARRKAFAPRLAAVDDGLLRKGATGDPAAARLVYERFEGWNARTDVNLSGNVSLAQLAEMLADDDEEG